MLSPEVIDTFNNETKRIYESIYVNEQDYFIEKDTYDNAGLFDWLLSKGTNIDCYILYVNETNSSRLNNINNKINTIRIIFYSMLKPFESQFFYWTLLLFIIHKFNFRKPIMKLVLYHYVLRAIGDIIDKLGELLSSYHSIKKDGSCVSEVVYTEQHPLRWALTRQFNSFFWYSGEIIGDWYPLLRTKAVARDKKSMIYIYGTCILYNLSKLSIPISQLFLNPTKLYTKEGYYDKDYVDKYYNYYSCLLVAIIASSLIYDTTVYLVLKKELFNKRVSEFGFLKKFRSISEYRIIISAIIGVIGLPFTLITAVAKVVLYNNEMKDLNFSIENFRNLVNNVQYMIIFIDQILLIRSRDESSMETYGDTNKKTNCSSSNYYSSNAAASGNYYNSNLDSSYYNSNIRGNGKSNNSSHYYPSTIDSKKYLNHYDYNNRSEMSMKEINRPSLQYGAYNRSSCDIEFYENDSESNYYYKNNKDDKENNKYN